MAARFSAEPLTERRVAQAYPLVRMVAPSVTLAEWRQHARRFLRRPEDEAPSAGPRGLFAMRNAGSYIHGLFGYRIDPVQPRRLLVRPFIAFHLLSRPELVGAMLDRLDGLGREHGCAAIFTRLVDAADALLMIDDATMKEFREAGHHSVAGGLVKELS